jgi:hypothetical protein
MSDDLWTLRESEIDAMIAEYKDKFNAIRQYVGECNAFGDEPELDTLIELVGGVDE